MVDPAKTEPVLMKLMADFAAAQEDGYLEGFIDDRMLEMEENDPGLFALLQHMIAIVKEDVTPDQAGHLLFCLAICIHKAQKTS